MPTEDISIRKISQFINPYTRPQEELIRSQVWVDPEDKALLHAIFPLRGLETFLLGGIYKQVCTDLRNHNITYYTPDNARRAYEIIQRHLTAVFLTGQGRDQDGSRGTDQVHEPDPVSKNVPTDVHEEPTRRRGASGRKRRSERGKRKESTLPKED